jgi:hypothetical protein
MVFTTFTGTEGVIVDTIADGLISTGSWVENDSFYTTNDGVTRGRSIKYVYNTVTEIYVTMIIASWGRTDSGYEFFGASGIIFFVSSEYDYNNHLPSGTVKYTTIPTFSRRYGAVFPSYPYTNACQAWLSYEADMLVIVTQTVVSAQFRPICLLCMERETDKEYDDLQSNWFIYNTAQRQGYHSSSSSNISWGQGPYAWTCSTFNNLKSCGPYKYIHPWIASYPISAMAECLISNRNDNFEFNGGSNTIRNCCNIPIRAIKSAGDSKVYMGFPVVYNDVGQGNNIPIKAMKSWFPVEPGLGIASGDLITIPTTWNGRNVNFRYLYINVVSLDGLQLDVAIKHSEV